MTWVLFDYGGVICEPQPEVDRARLARASGGPVADFEAAYWRYRLDYDRAALDAAAYWQRVAADLGRSYTGAQIAELSRLDTASWLTLQPGTVDLIIGLAAAGQRLAVLSNAPADVAEAVQRLPLAGHFEHLVFSCALKSAKPDPECFRATLAVLQAGPGDVIFLDDRPDNVAGAAALGIRSVQFTGAPAARADLARHGIAPAGTPA
jgi:putative hydrolase of the HAD superfamily